MIGNDEAQQVLVQAERLAKAGDLRRFQREYGENVVAVAVLLDGVGEAAFAPTIGGGDGAAVLGDALVDAPDRRLDRGVLEIRTQHSDNLVVSQSVSHPS